MVDSDDVEELRSKYICWKCIGESYLREEIRKDGVRHRCSYCESRRKSSSTYDLAARVAKAFEQHYSRTSDQPDALESLMISDRDSSYNWERSGDPIVQAIENAAEIPAAAAQDIQVILDYEHSDFDSAAMGEETEFSDDTFYAEKAISDHAWLEEWNSFVQSLKTETRFFSRFAAAHLNAVFTGIEGLKTADHKPLIVDAGPDTALPSIYRGRVFQSEEKLKEAIARPEVYLGSPPAALASSGRMNARGISVFYGANTRAGAIAEVRPPVGSAVAVARFGIVRALRLLDMTASSAAATTGSIFDPLLAGRLEHVMFLRTLSRLITRPVMPDDEGLDYLSTQAVADFLASLAEPVIDGMVFPSVQAAGDVVNVVLFHKAARVEASQLPSGTEISAHTGGWSESGWEPDYTVLVNIPVEEEASADSGRDEFEWNAPLFPGAKAHGSDDDDHRPVTLRIASESLQVHVVERVQFSTIDFNVNRYQVEMRVPRKRATSTDF